MYGLKVSVYMSSRLLLENEKTIAEDKSIIKIYRFLSSAANGQVLPMVGN